MAMMTSCDFDVLRACAKKVVSEHRAACLLLVKAAEAGQNCVYVARHPYDAREAMNGMREFIENWKEWKVREFWLTHSSGGEIWVIPGEDISRRMPGHRPDLAIVG